jgi:hypothetical protein
MALQDVLLSPGSAKWVVRIDDVDSIGDEGAR